MELGSWSKQCVESLVCDALCASFDDDDGAQSDGNVPLEITFRETAVDFVTPSSGTFSEACEMDRSSNEADITVLEDFEEARLSICTDAPGAEENMGSRLEPMFQCRCVDAVVIADAKSTMTMAQLATKTCEVDAEASDVFSSAQQMSE